MSNTFTILLLLGLLSAAACGGCDSDAEAEEEVAEVIAADTTAPLQPEAGIPLDSIVRRVAIPSSIMNKVYNAYVILPESYYTDSTARTYPVLYLLHGHGGQFSDWYERVPELSGYSTTYEIIIVTPEGATNSWYIDSPVDSTIHFYTYLSVTVPEFIDSHFRTRRERAGHGITGASMGGHGALLLAAQRPELFGAAGSMSGVVDLRPFADRWELPLRLGELKKHANRYDSLSVVEVLPELGAAAPALYIDCGTEDELITVNRELHVALLEANLPHYYAEHPGGHNWLYWGEAIAYQLLFFNRFFDQQHEEASVPAAGATSF